MAILANWNDRPISINVKPTSITIGIEYSTFSNVYSFDHQGRPWTALIDQVSYRRGLDGRTVAKWITADGGRKRRWLSPEEAESVAEQARILAMALYQAISQNMIHLPQPLPPEGLTGLANAASFDQDARLEEIDEYNKIYLPVGILPPDQYGAVVLQATEGCSFNACTFCSFYKDRSFHIKSSQEYENHCTKVIRFLGRGMSLKRTIFLGDANALVIPMKHLLPMFEITHRYFDVEALGGIFAFLDGISGEKKPARIMRFWLHLVLNEFISALRAAAHPCCSICINPIPRRMS